jgi:hypothetical protein
MVLALLLAPHRRSLRTIAGMVLGRREHAATISRRLRNRRWKTRDWYVTLYDQLLEETDRWERRRAGGRKRHWLVTIDTTFHTTHSQCMENLILMNRRRDSKRRHTRQHAFVMGLVLTDKGGRFPLPRRSYYTPEYCQKKRRRYRTQTQLAAEMLRFLHVPDDVEVTVVFDSAFDANEVHEVCQKRGFRAVFPLDPNRNRADVPPATDHRHKVVHWTKTWSRGEFALLELQNENEDHVFFRRRHRDNLRPRKTYRRYAVAARQGAVTNLGTCLIVASYKENPSVELGAGQAGDWWTFHEAPVIYDRHQRPQPQRWHAKVLACTDPTATARQVIEWYEVRWQIELFFRELKSRMQFCGYVLMKFEAVERYIDLLLIGSLLLEGERLRDMQAAGPPADRGGEPWLHARTTDRLRLLDTLCAQWNAENIEERISTQRGRQQLLQDLREASYRVA